MGSFLSNGRAHLFLSAAPLIAIPNAASAQPAKSPAVEASQGQAAEGEVGLADIVVTAQRRSERLQNVPIAVNVISGAALGQRGVLDTLSIGSAVPGLSFTQTGPAATPFLRGVGSTGGNPNDEPSVATYVDGVYIAAPQATLFELTNIDRVEVLKGPQGTLFGRNATGGVIQVVTRDPSRDPSADVSVSYESYDKVKGSIYATGPLTGTVAADLSLFFQEQADGWGRNILTGNDVYYENIFSARSKILFEPSDDTSIVLAGDYTRNRNRMTAFRLAKGARNIAGLFAPEDGYDVTGNILLNGHGDNDQLVSQRGASLTINQDVGFAELKSISSYRKVKILFIEDNDTSPLQVLDAELHEGQRNVSQELQLFSHQDDPIQYLVGAYLFQSYAFYDPGILQGAATGGATTSIYGQQRTRSGSLYGQATAELFADTKLTAGLRYTKEKQRFRSEVNGFALPTLSQDTSKPTWRIALDREFSRDVHVYASYNRGIKSGGFDLLSPGSTGYAPEQLDAYELGFKGELLRRRLRLNASLFYYDYKNIQVQVIQGATLVTTNAAAARVQGLDVDFQALPVKNLTISGGFALLDGKYKDFQNAISYPASPLDGAQSIVDASGNRTIRTPKFSGNLSADLRIPSSIGTFNATVFGSYSSAFYYAADNRLRQKAYGLLNASIGWRDSSDLVGLTLFGRNLTDTYYYNQAVPSALGDLTTPGAPRTIGVRASLSL